MQVRPLLPRQYEPVIKTCKPLSCEPLFRMWNYTDREDLVLCWSLDVFMAATLWIDPCSNTQFQILLDEIILFNFNLGKKKIWKVYYGGMIFPFPYTDGEENYLFCIENRVIPDILLTGYPAFLISGIRPDIRLNC